MSSDIPRGGRAATPVGAATAAVRAGRKALELVASETGDTYLANSERQLAIERLLIRFGEALKRVPNETLTQIDSNIAIIYPLTRSGGSGQQTVSTHRRAEAPGNHAPRSDPHS